MNEAKDKKRPRSPESRWKEDEELIARVKKGDYDAFERLVRKYEARIFHHCLKFLNNQDEAEDILQETFLQVYKSLDSFRGEAAFSTWLIKIATNNCLMRIRKKKKVDIVSIDKPIEIDGSQLPREIVDWSKNPFSQVSNDEIRAVLDQAISGLPEDKRVILVLKDVEGFSNIEIAQMLGISVAAVKSRLHRARLYVRDIISKYFDDKLEIIKTGSNR
ncbi:RNA polymerase sigma-70 factor [hydrothermal vent metagenome]|uniref:RNA polymerase sigma-70 factor n=1 Tax=hydrothermal vent metagenome TaxID=652676 RepID=A0A3B1BM18_9ZZZZ